MIDFQDLYKSHAENIYRFALWLSSDRQEAEDITSETFIRAWAHHKKIRTETLNAYLLTIARNIYLQHLRKNKRQAVLKDVHPDPAAGPDEQTESQHLLTRIQTVLRTLPEIDRAAFLLRVHHGLPYDEIARILPVTPAAGKVKVYRVRKKLIAECIDKEAI
jgi:RNA polymerase sigma-70 factor (ECF subfamily)